MAKPKKYNYSEIEYSYYDMDLCLQKDRILELLSLSTPKKVLRFNSKGSYWGFCEYANTYHLVINGGILHFTTYADSFSDVIDFFDELMHTNNKTLICPFKAEGDYTLLIVTPVDEKLIRCTTFAEKEYGDRNSIYITADIIINKQTFIKQFKYYIEKMNVEYTKYMNERLQTEQNNKIWLEKFLHYFDEFIERTNKYLDNPKKIQQIPFERYWVRIFDIAYKTYCSDWNFVIAFNEDERGNIEFWEKLKAEKEIMDYDYIEQTPIHKEQLITDIKTNMLTDKYSSDIKTDFETRKWKNWCYSSETEKWYSENEIMDEQKLPYTLIEEFYSSYGVNTTHEYRTEIELIQDYIRNETSDCRWLGCYVNLVSDNNLYTFEYNYSEKDELIENLNRIKNGDTFRFFLGRLECNKRMHVWQKENGYIKILYQETAGSSMKKDTDIFRLIVKKEEFVNAFLSAISSVEDEINEVKKVIKNLNNV